jgi:predicted site-specific integrase-resolvase
LKRLFNVASVTNTCDFSEPPGRVDVIYARVSTQKQRDDLQAQVTRLTDKYPDAKIIRDIGSGHNFK